MFLVEGAVADWSALFLSLARRMDVPRAGYGFAVFSLAMTVMRLVGDRLVIGLGRRMVAAVGALLAAAGFLLCIAVPLWPASLVGLALVGMGSANIVPVLFAAAGRQSAMSEATAVPAMTTLGYSGLLVGPAIVGFVARGFGLPAAFGLLGVLLLAVAAASRFLELPE